MKVRNQLVEIRTKLCNGARGLIKSHGYRLPKAQPEAVTKLLGGALPEPLLELIAPLWEQVERLKERIRKLDQELAELAKKEYPQTKYVNPIYGVGPILSLAFVVTMDEASRFRRSRDVASYLGLTPAQDQSGDSNPELRITRDGDGLIRALLVNSAQTILRKNSPDCDLKRHGEKLAAKGGKLARKKAVVGVARKLAVLMHKLLVSKAPYNPQHNKRQSRRLASRTKQQGRWPGPPAIRTQAALRLRPRIALYSAWAMNTVADECRSGGKGEPVSIRREKAKKNDGNRRFHLTRGGLLMEAARAGKRSL